MPQCQGNGFTNEGAVKNQTVVRKRGNYVQSLANNQQSEFVNLTSLFEHINLFCLDIGLTM